jgi:DNA primase
MALSPAFLDELRARTSMADLVGRKVKLHRSGRNLVGLCPFHAEKTPSFYVYDDGFHCFGCGAHGDAISFVMQSQGAEFTEAVEGLAGQAGLELPRPSPVAAEAERRRENLHSILEAARASFQRRLFLPEGRGVLDYVRSRGLNDATTRRFGLGWSSGKKGALAADLAGQGIGPEQLAQAGLMRPIENAQVTDLFLNRLMFPIRDRKGRVISFGGRILGDGQPKYINGPDTTLFSKRRTLYGVDLAREAAREGASVLVVEGYLDVITLHQAGFGGAVAPLGTALTEEQFKELWRLAPAPVLCFDGDAAGARAAARAAEVAVSLLAPDRTLRIAMLPSGEDPDSLIRRKGGDAFRAVLEGARPLAEALFQLMREGVDQASPEHRAAFRVRLEDTARRIPDRALAGEYRRALLDQFFESRRRRGPPPPPSRPDHRPDLCADRASAERGRILTAILLRHPGLLRDVEHAYAQVELFPPLARLRQAIMGWATSSDVLDSRALIDHLTSIGLAAEAAQALSAVPVPLPDCASPDAMPAQAEAGWWHIFGLMHRGRLEEEVAAASREFEERGDEAAQLRLVALCAAREALRRGEQGGEAET